MFRKLIIGDIVIDNDVGDAFSPILKPESPIFNGLGNSHTACCIFIVIRKEIWISVSLYAESGTGKFLTYDHVF